MELSFMLSSGYFDIDKKTFVKDILLGKSTLRSLINKKESGCIEPEIEKSDTRVKVIFDDASDTELGQEYESFFIDLKKRYKEKLKGKIAVRVVCNASYFSVIDLNSDDDSVKFY